MEILISVTSLIISIVAFLVSVWFYLRQFRPIVSAMVKTNSAGNMGIVYSLEVINCGSLPAKNITIRMKKGYDINEALGTAANKNNYRKLFLKCFETEIPILHNNSTTQCSFGMTGKGDNDFWKYEAKIPVIISYSNFWSSKKYEESIELHVIDSTSFTGGSWSTKK